MAAKKTSDPVLKSASKDVVAALESLADGLKIAAGELWGIFVRQFVVKGLSELFTALVFLGIAYLLKDHVGYWALIPVSVSVFLVYDSINLLGNPKYFALNDITKKMNELKRDV